MQSYISIQQNPIDLNQVYQFLEQGQAPEAVARPNKTSNNDHSNGAVVVFTGLMRAHNEQGEAIKAMAIEHYPAMTEKKIKNLAEAVGKQHRVTRLLIIHRFGALTAGERIVMVGATARHRVSAFAAARQMMDFLKNEAPFWKKELLVSGKDHWVAPETGGGAPHQPIPDLDTMTS